MGGGAIRIKNNEGFESIDGLKIMIDNRLALISMVVIGRNISKKGAILSYEDSYLHMI